MTRRVLAGVAAAWLAAAVVAAMADIRVTPLVDKEGRVFASFAAGSAFTDDAREVVQSGLPLTLSYLVELRRPLPLWFDVTLGSSSLAASVRFDNLTGAYQVSKLLDGRVVWSDRTSAEAEMRTWVTEFDRVPIEVIRPLEPNADYYVRVRLWARPRRTFSLWPWGSDDGNGRGDFTFLRPVRRP